jgi:integrase
MVYLDSIDFWRQFGDSIAMKELAKIVDKKPFEIKKASVVVKIYTVNNNVNGSVYPQYTLVYKSGNQRFRKKFADMDAAKREGKLVATKLANGENEILKLTSTDRAIYLQVCRELRPYNFPLNVAVSDYISSVSRLPQGTTLREVVDFFLWRNPASLIEKTVREVVDELIEVKTKTKRGDKHLADLSSRLGRFADAMEMNIGLVTGVMIQMYLDSKDVTGRTRLNHLRHINSLFKFAVRKKYLLKDAMDEIQAVEKPEMELTEIEIFSLDELQEILKVARPEILPWLAIAAFAGLRNAELQRLDWNEVNLTERHIEVTAAKSKTASRRLVPITDNLLAWLKKYKQSSGRITGFENMAKQISWLAQELNNRRGIKAEMEGCDPKAILKFAWKRNALRHSFISYRTAALKDVAAVALEAGNSPAMIFKHYRALVTEKEAAKWFEILPEPISPVDKPIPSNVSF